MSDMDLEHSGLQEVANAMRGDSITEGPGQKRKRDSESADDMRRGTKRVSPTGNKDQQDGGVEKVGGIVFARADEEGSEVAPVDGGIGLDHGGRRVVEARRIAGGDRAVRTKRGLQSRQRFDRGVGTIGFVLIEWRSKAPLIPLRIFRSRTTSAANVGSFALLGSFFSFMFIVTLYLQEVLHYSPLLASLALLPAGLASLPVCALLTPRLVNRLGMRLSAVLGLLCLAIGIALFTRIGPSSDYFGVILLPMLITITLGMSVGVPSLSIAAVSGIANEEQGLAAGLQSTAMQVGGGLWLAITTAVVVGSNTQTQASAPQSLAAVQAQLNGFHLALLVVALVAAAGALIALVGIQNPPAAAPQVSTAAPQASEEEVALRR